MEVIGRKILIKMPKNEAVLRRLVLERPTFSWQFRNDSKLFWKSNYRNNHPRTTRHKPQPNYVKPKTRQKRGVGSKNQYQTPKKVPPYDIPNYRTCPEEYKMKLFGHQCDQVLLRTGIGRLT